SVLSPVTGLFCHRRSAGKLPTKLDASVGAPGPHGFAVRLQHHSSRTSVRLSCRVHRIPHPTSVTIAIRPSREGGMARSCKDDLPDGLSEIFFARGLDRHVADLPVGQISWAARASHTA